MNLPLAVQDNLGSPRRKKPGAPPAPEVPAPKADWAHQFRTLVRRYLSVIIGDRRNTVLLILQAPVLGFLMLVVLGHGNLRASNPGARGTAGTVLVALVLASTYLGASNSIREIVKERAILTRELSVGVSPSAYVLSKVVVLGALTVLQALILSILGLVRQQGPGHGALIPAGAVELFVVVALTGLSAMGLGLLVSAVVSSPDRALTILPVILFGQFLMTGAVFNLNHTPVLNQVAYLTSARWGYAAAASTADLDRIEGSRCNLGAVRPRIAAGADCDRTHRHSPEIWLLDAGVLLVLTGVTVAGSLQVIRPLGRPRRRSGFAASSIWWSLFRLADPSATRNDCLRPSGESRRG